MNLQTVNKAQAFGLLEQDTVLVTATRRLSRHLSLLYSLFQQGKKRTVWETPAIMPMNTWLEKCFFFMEEKEKPYLLTSEQEEALWEGIISSSHPEHGFPGMSLLSETAARAWEIVVRYKLSWLKLQDSQDREISEFVRWAVMFGRLCSEKKFLSRAGLPGFMIRSLEKSLVSLPQTLILAGFYEFDPVQKDLLLALEKKQVNLRVLDQGSSCAKPCKTSFNEFKKEAEIAARWALNLTLENPEARVGIVVPGLESHRSGLIRIFDHVFHPETIVNICEPEKRIFNISLGTPLGRYPLVRCALVFLELLRKDRWDIRELGVVLSSPFIRAGSDEFAARAALDTRIRRGSRPWRPAGSVLEMAGQKGEPFYCPVLVQIVAQAVEMLSLQDRFQSPARWAAHFSLLLKTAGWPDSRKMNSFEYQTFQAFKEELSGLSRLEAVLEPITYQEALRRFKKILNSRPFQPESGLAPVQVLGLFEAMGLDFDHLWVMNLNSDVLPGPSKPNPLLPVELQRRYQTPGSSPGRELDLAARIMNLLLCSSQEIIFSYSVREDDREILESPLIRTVPYIGQEKIEIHESRDIFSLMAGNSGLTAISDDFGLPLTQDWLPGGAKIFQDQALCPFKGYAAHRLGAAAPEEPVFALTSVDRGNLVHRALMRVWQEIGSLEELKEMVDEDSLDFLLDETASMTVREFPGRGHVLFTPEFMSLEQARLKNVIGKWLEKELERSDFEVLALEQAEYVHINSIRIKTRMDRLDRLENGRVVVIDYKTGAAIDNVEDIWMGDRIIEPQLPIYSRISGEKPAGVVLAQVNPRTFRFHGIIEGEEIRLRGNSLKTPADLGLSGIKEILDQWSDRLEIISREIKGGYALVDPLPQSGSRTCRYCDFKPLCRIREQNS